VFEHSPGEKEDTIMAPTTNQTCRISTPAGGVHGKVTFQYRARDTVGVTSYLCNTDSNNYDAE
jgi:hypothetical protein